MSVERITEVKTGPVGGPRLRLLPAPVARVSTLGFVGILVLLIAAGLSGVMLVTTTVSAQSKELTALRQEVTVLTYQAEGLESDYQRVTSTNALALRAAELGMVPNPHPAFIDLAAGTITGEPTPVSGEEMPFLQGVPQSEPAPQPAAPPAGGRHTGDEPQEDLSAAEAGE